MKEMLFKRSEAVAALNYVEGFDPAEYARVIQKEGQIDQLYLDVAIRKLWFRLKYPLGKIKKMVLSLNENMAAVEARIYLDKNDLEDQYIASGFSQKFRTMDEIFGDKFMEMAETAAVGRALADAGFGIQFADVSGESDMEQVDAGMQMSENGGLESGNVSFSPDMAAPIYPQLIPEGYMAPSPQIPYQNPHPVAPSPVATQRPAMPGVAAGGMPERVPAPELDRRAPVETLSAQMDYAQAVKVIIQGNGKWAGKTLGQVTVESPSTIAFFAGESYKGPDNLVRAAAQVILAKAQVA